MEVPADEPFIFWGDSWDNDDQALFWGKTYYPSASNSLSATEVSIAVGETLSVTLDLPYAGSIAGWCIDSDSNKIDNYTQYKEGKVNGYDFEFGMEPLAIATDVSDTNNNFYSWMGDWFSSSYHIEGVNKGIYNLKYVPFFVNFETKAGITDINNSDFNGSGVVVLSMRRC